MKKLILVAIIIVVVLLATSNSGVSTPVRTRPAAPTKVTGYDVKYAVTGTAGSVDITMSNASGGTEQFTKLLPWSTTFHAPSGAFLYISAQNTGDSGTVTAQILVDSKLIQESKSSGAYVIASVSELLP